MIEDCAQAFDFQYKGDQESDVVLFSFGLIKTNTCLTGALAIFNNVVLFKKVKTLNERLPVQPARKYFTKMGKALLIKFVTVNWVYTLFYSMVSILKRDFDDSLSKLTKGFPGADVKKKIALRPCHANLQLLRKRTDISSHHAIQKRKEVALQLIAMVPARLKIGAFNTRNSFWVLPVESEDPEKLIALLRQQGIDATSKASSLTTIGTFPDIENKDELKLSSLVYIPIAKSVIKKIRPILPHLR